MKSKSIALYGIIIAVIVAAYFADSQLSALFLSFLGIRIAVLTLITVLTICQLFDLKTAVFTSTIFGLMSFLFAFILPNITSPVFMNPLVSVFPRVMIGLVSFTVFKQSKKIFAKNTSIFVRNILPRAIAGGIGVLTNTILVIGMMAVTNNQDILARLIAIIISVNFLVEFLCGIFIVPTVSARLSRIKFKF